LIKITSNSISSVPKVESDVISEQYWEQLYNEHIELLKLAQDKQIGTECARVFDLRMKKLGSDFIGKPADNRVLVSNFDSQHIIIHNHADGSTISLEDFNSFLRRPQTLSIQAISNGGTVFILEKLPHFNAVSAIKKYLIALDNVYELLECETARGKIESIVEEFLLSLNENGFKYRRWET